MWSHLITHLIIECPNNKQENGNGCNIVQSLSVAQQDRGAPRGASFGMNGVTDHVYPLNNRQEQKNSTDVVTGMIQVFGCTIYLLLDPGTSLYL